MRKFIKLFEKVNGFQVLKEYARARVLCYAVVMTALLGTSKKSLEIVRLAISNKILKRIRKKYKYAIENIKHNKVVPIKEVNKNVYSDKVWVCWFQGIDKAPDIVKKCYNSINKYIPDREIVLITQDNYKEYVQFPNFICEKIDSGVISKTHLSDLLRLELLYRYGGTWIDATVYLTDTLPDYMLNSDLFLFQDLKPGLDGHCQCISSWFISAKKGNKLIYTTLQLLYEYWKHNNYLIDYFLIHDMFQLAIETYPNEWNKVIPYSNAVPHMFLLRFFDKYDDKMWQAIKAQCPVHKLSYKFSKKQKNLKNTFYKKIIEQA